jgi:CRISPR-associated protein Csx16
MTVIVTRHAGALEWLKAKGFEGTVVDHISAGDVQSGETIVGVLPITLVKQLLDKKCEVIVLQLPDVPKEMRGKELTADDMDRYGARLFRIKVLEWEEL